MTFSKLTLFLVTIAFSATIVSAQPRSFKEGEKRDGNTQRNRLMKVLGLTQVQFQKVRAINQETRPLKRKAAIALRKARRGLNEAIYADNSSEESVEANIRSVVLALSEVTRINAMHELRIRQVLTAEQLVKFRELRKKVSKRKRLRANPRNQNRRRRQKRDRPPIDEQRQPF